MLGRLISKETILVFVKQIIQFKMVQEFIINNFFKNFGDSADTLPYNFAVNAVNVNGTWTLLKVVLTPLNVYRYRLLKNEQR